jgi:hypothetical protein
MKKLLFKQTLIIALVAFCGFAYSQEAVLLKYNFTNGKTYVQNTQFTSNVTQSMGGQEMKFLSDVNSATEYSVENVQPEGNVTILVSLLNVSLRQVAMGRDTTMKFNDLKDKVRVVYSSNGKPITTTKIDSSTVSRMLGSMDQYTKLQVLPNKSITVGEKWQDKIEEVKKTGGPFPMNESSDMEYTLVGKETKDGKDYYKISFTGTLAINGKGSRGGMDMFLEGTGKTEGFSLFDPTLSMIVYAETQTDMDMSIAISGQQNMTMPMSQSIKGIFKMEEKK